MRTGASRYGGAHAANSRAEMRRKKKHPVHVGKALEDLTASLGIRKSLREYSVMTEWESIVGSRIARVTRPERMDKGVLFVAVSTAPWRAELSMRKRELMEKINAAAGSRVVSDIRFR